MRKNVWFILNKKGTSKRLNKLGLAPAQTASTTASTAAAPSCLFVYTRVYKYIPGEHCTRRKEIVRVRARARVCVSFTATITTLWRARTLT